MNRKNATRKALLLSVISLLLCCTMLVGTTFAWFTDSVTSGLNSIVAGNLDIELEYSKNATNWDSVSGKTDLFSGALWEPGHTEVVYLRLTNKGTLALNYQLGINVKSETPAKNVEGKEFKLSDYIQFGIVEGQSTAFASRAAAVAAVTNGKPLNAGYTKASAMTAQNETAALALVVYMPESVGNEANYRGTAPQIELGINVVASQKTQESEIPEGSDKPADLPQATVTQKPEYENVDLTWESFGGFAPTPGLDSQLEAAYEFKVQQTLEEIQAGAYANWHCDFYVKLDRDLGADQIFLGGNYGSFGWVGFHNGDLTLAANSEIPLLGRVTQNPWTYEDVASFVGTFTCGVGDVDDALAGATFTVMLRLTNPEDATEYYNVATITHTFEDSVMVVSNSDELAAAIAAGETNLWLNDGTYTLPDAAKGKTLLLSGTSNAVIEHVNQGEDGMNYSLEGSTVTFNGVTIKTTSGTYRGFARSAKIVYNKCNFVGSYTLGAGTHTFNECNFNLQSGYVWTWGGESVTFNNCVFEDQNGAAKAILVHNTVDTVVTVNNCKFNATTKAYTWDGIQVAAVSVDPNGAHTVVVNFEGTNTVSDAFNGNWQVKYPEEASLVTVNE